MYEIFEQLLQKHGVSSYRISKETGIAQSVLSAWKNGVSTPKQDKMQKIADYFGVSLEYLMTGKEEPDGYYLDNDTKDMIEFLCQNPEYKVLFDATRKVKPEDINFIKEMIERMGRE